MLKGMRKSAKHILWPLTIAMVISMGGYGVWYLVRPEASRTEIGAAWGEPVRLEEFIQTARTTRAIAALGGREMDRRELYMTTWQRILLNRQAERMEISATRRDLARFLAQWPAFQVDGSFSPERYSLVLSRLGLEPTTFEDEVEKLLGIEVLRMLVQSQALVTPADAARAYQRSNEEIRVAYARIGTEDISPLEEIPEEKMSEYYRQNQDQFQVQTEIAISYILLEFDDFTGDGAEEPEGESPPLEEAGPGEGARERAAERANEISRTLVEENSLAGPAEEYGLKIRQSGYFPLDGEIPGVGPVPEIGQMVGWMEEGEPASYPVEVEDGYLIFQLEGIREARNREFEEVREEIRAIFLDQSRREEAGKIAEEKLTRINSLIEEGKDFTTAAGEVELETGITSFFTRQGREDLPDAPQFTAMAFLTPLEEVSGLIPGEDGFYFIKVLERRPAPPMPEDEAEQWLEIATQIRAGRLYESWFNNLIRRSGFSISDEEFAP